MILSQAEGQPASYPAVTGLSDEASALDAAAIWQRIEQWIAYRWGERTVAWIVAENGDWLPPLGPVAVDSVERWTDTGYEAATLDPAPLGLRLDGTYRISATVGSADDPPPAVTEAFIRFAEYLVDSSDMGRVVTSQSVKLGSGLDTQTARPVTWHAKALHYSGAADLLRPYRVI